MKIKNSETGTNSEFPLLMLLRKRRLLLTPMTITPTNRSLYTININPLLLQRQETFVRRRTAEQQKREC